jgi:hypothetical protein
MVDKHYLAHQRDYAEWVGAVFVVLGVGVGIFAFVGMGKSQDLEVKEVIAHDQSSVVG